MKDQETQLIDIALSRELYSSPEYIIYEKALKFDKIMGVLYQYRRKTLLNRKLINLDYPEVSDCGSCNAKV